MTPPLSCFTRHEDGRITVDDWYREQWFTAEYLRLIHAVPLLSNTLGAHHDKAIGRLSFEVSNGRAVYKLMEWDCARRMCKGVLIEAELDVLEEIAE